MSEAQSSIEAVTTLSEASSSGNGMPIQISQEDYDREFGLHSHDKRRENAHGQALDIRKFEIQLYWTRAAYFWTFIAAALAAYGAIQALDVPETRVDLSVVVACVGLVFSFAWYCVNRGSKHWQENWENHVDLLEDSITGPLYKVVLRRRKATGILKRLDLLVTGPAAFSVSKINQVISLYICGIWLLLIWYALPHYTGLASMSRLHLGALSLSLLTTIMIAWRGRTFAGEYDHTATIRESAIRSDVAN